MNLEHLKNRLRANEGYSKDPYKDHLGNWTIGYGHLIEWITDRDLHESWLDSDIASAIKIAHTFAGESWDSLTDTRREVLVEMGFQLGSRLLKFVNFRGAVREGDHARAVTEMLDSKWAEQTPNRAKMLAKLYEMG